MSLTYDTMLKGVPGTGTRKQGLEGAMLKCTMDGIVLIRFNGKRLLSVLNSYASHMMACS